MSFLDELRDKRRKFLDGLEANREDIKLDIFTDFYPDKAHFIYELLQNAEDTRASEVSFLLSEQSLWFEHDGRPFDEEDIRTITGIGVGTKSDDDDKIGRFGIGFKAVFVYTETPRIWSPTFAFEISNFVMPAELAPDSSFGNCTRFEFPFNSPKKSASDAFSAIRAGLEEISEATLLFLSHIEAIHWRFEGGAKVSLLRVPHSEYHIETLKESEGKAIESSHFLRFTKPVEGLERQYAAIAFDLQALPNVSSFDSNKPLSKQFRIVPAVPGRVAVFFTATKETSGLRFHLHAPFVPELSRASIKDTPLNMPLFRELAELSARSLFTIRDLGLLTADFLAVLPSPHDDLPARYECIRETIVVAMNEQPLTPTHARAHAPARQLLQAPPALKALVENKDLELLVDFENGSPVWAIAAMQNSNVDRFLSSLAIDEWGVEQFVTVLEDGLSTVLRYDVVRSVWMDCPHEELVTWLHSKSEEWHQRLYALLYRELEPGQDLHRFGDLCIVRLSSANYKKGNECYFPNEEVREDPLLPRVAERTYTSGRSKADQGRARKFLEAVGVREVGEYEQVEAILKQRYARNSKTPTRRVYEKDLRSFISLTQDNPRSAVMFSNYWIFELEDGKWGCPDQVYLDSPYVDTGLHALYRKPNDDGHDGRPVALADRYRKIRVPREALAEFAKNVGAHTRLTVKWQSTHSHRESGALRQDYRRYGVRWRHTGIDDDWTISELELVLENPTEALSRLVWTTLMRADTTVLEARFRPNQQYTTRREPSTLVLILRELSWLPQEDGNFVPPAKASQDLLPAGFLFDPGWPWIMAIGFGEEGAKRVEERRRTREIAIELGIDDAEALDDAKRFAELDPDIRRRILDEHESTTDLPNHKPGDPNRRTETVREQAKDAPERATEERTRTISVNRERVKKEKTVPYLRGLYTNADGVTICQVCKGTLPFKLADGTFYFESVEFLPELEKHHHQNYLALCPNHAAMYTHANGSRETMKDTFLGLDGNEFEVLLAEESSTLYFNSTHILDLKAVIEADETKGT